MKTYKTIKIDNLEIISKKIYQTIVDAGLPLRSDAYYLDYVETIFPGSGITEDRFRKIPELLEQMTILGFEPYWLGSTIVLMYADHVPPIHKDCVLFGYSFNIPVINTKNTHTIWYESSQPCREVSVAEYLGGTRNNDSLVTYMHFDNEYCTEIDRVELIQPALLNIDTPHNVVLGDCEVPRITLCLRLSRDFDPVKLGYSN